jgi:hypothetical protein
MIPVELFTPTISMSQHQEKPVAFQIETPEDFFLKAKNFMDVLGFTV